MTYGTTIGIDLAKNVFQVHGALLSGEVKFRRKLSRQHFRRFMAGQGASIVVMEACGSAHYWSREMTKLGHEVRLIAPQYVRPFVKRQKNDAADAEAIFTAAQRPEMRFVTSKLEEQQAEALLLRQRSHTAISVFFADFSIPRIASKFSLFETDKIHARWLSAWDTQKTLPDPVRASARRYS